jgi:hypothetical protein
MGKLARMFVPGKPSLMLEGKANVIKLFSSLLMNLPNKLECLSLAKPSLIMLEGKVNAIKLYLRMSKSVCLWQA